MTEPRVSAWNLWWALMILAMVFTAVILVLEGVGLLKDLGLVLTGLGFLASLAFGFSATTRTSVRTIRSEIQGVRSDLGGVVAALTRIERLLDTRLPAPPQSPR